MVSGVDCTIGFKSNPENERKNRDKEIMIVALVSPRLFAEPARVQVDRQDSLGNTTCYIKLGLPLISQNMRPETQ